MHLVGEEEEGISIMDIGVSCFGKTRRNRIPKRTDRRIKLLNQKGELNLAAIISVGNSPGSSNLIPNDLYCPRIVYSMDEGIWIQHG